MSPMQWIADHLGRSVDFDGYCGPQCVDAANDFISSIDPEAGHWHAARAADMPAERIKGWEWVPNGLVNYPPAGAVVVWGRSPEAGVGSDGHTAIALGADPDMFLSLDQNWGGARYLRVVPHKYPGVLGWFAKSGGKLW